MLQDEEVAFVVVGGVAIGLHGSAYRTQDIDVVYARDRDNLERLVKALRPFRPRLRVLAEPDGVPFVFDAHTILNGGNFTLTSDLGDIDILAAISGLGGYEKVAELAEAMPLLSKDRPTLVLSLDGLILAKRAANRPKDLLVLPELESMRELRALAADRQSSESEEAPFWTESSQREPSGY